MLEPRGVNGIDVDETFSFCRVGGDAVAISLKPKQLSWREGAVVDGVAVRALVGHCVLTSNALVGEQEEEEEHATHLPSLRESHSWVWTELSNSENKVRAKMATGPIMFL